MSYVRVIPRDLFNEAKLLKCLGQLSLIMHDGIYGVTDLLNLNDENDMDGFLIDQDMDGSLYCASLHLYDNYNTSIHLSTPLNSKLPYPMTYTYDCGLGEQHDFLFDDFGNLSPEFIEAVKARRGNHD